MISHYAEAARLAADAQSLMATATPNTINAALEIATVSAAIAQVHATLAVAVDDVEGVAVGPAASMGYDTTISLTPTTGTVGGIDRAANVYWRNYAQTGLTTKTRLPTGPTRTTRSQIGWPTATGPETKPQRTEPTHSQTHSTTQGGTDERVDRIGRAPTLDDDGGPIDIRLPRLRRLADRH